MPAILLRNAGIYLNQYELSSVSNAITIETEREMFDTTAFGDSARAYTPGMLGVRFSASGFYDVDRSDAPLYELRDDTTDIVTTFAVDNAAGNPAFVLRGCVGTYSIGGAVNAAGTYSLTGQTTATPFIRGMVLHRHTAVIATGNGTAYDIGAASSTQGGYAGMHVFAVSGTATPTLNMVIESDSIVGMTTPTTKITFDPVTAVGAQWKSFSGANADTWYRAKWTITGTTPSFGFIVTFGIYPPV